MNEEQIKKMISDDFDNFINERLDSAIIFKYISNLEKENLKLKEQYCERTDCSGRLGNSKKVKELERENQQLKEDISFCLKSIKQEMEMSTDSRTKQEMLSCYQILSKWSDK